MCGVEAVDGEAHDDVIRMILSFFSAGSFDVVVDLTSPRTSDECWPPQCGQVLLLPISVPPQVWVQSLEVHRQRDTLTLQDELRLGGHDVWYC